MQYYLFYTYLFKQILLSSAKYVENRALLSYNNINYHKKAIYETEGIYICA